MRRRHQPFADTFAEYERLRKARTRSIQRASWAANTALHLPDGAALARRNSVLATFPERYSWIHSFDALKSAQEAPPS
jgi:salicylate hydroxylase